VSNPLFNQVVQKTAPIRVESQVTNLPVLLVACSAEEVDNTFVANDKGLQTVEVIMSCFAGRLCL
jgi:hypothetical protein